jgi:MFS family permease
MNQNPPNPQRWWILATGCVVAFAQLAEPQLWMMGLEIPASTFGIAWGEYRILANLGVVLFIAFQLIGGVLGDMFGRRRILLIGASGALLANLLSLLSNDLATLTIMRGIVGIFGALAYPLALANIRLQFSGDERKKALLIFSLVTAIGLLASLLAILITDWFGWRWTLALPISASVAGIGLAWRFLPESRADGNLRRVDAITAAAWTLVFLSAIFGLSVARTLDSWRNPITLASATLGGLGLLVMIFWTRLPFEPRVAQAQVEVPHVFLALLLLASSTLSFALSGYVIQLYIFFFSVAQWSVFFSGFALLPIILGPMLVIRWAIRFSISNSHPVVIATGLIGIATALLITATIGLQSSYFVLIPAMAIFGIGFMLASTSWTYLFFSTLPGDLIGVSSGINRAAGLVGSALAGAILSSIVQVTGIYDLQRRLAQAGVPDELQDRALSFLNIAMGKGFTDDRTTTGQFLEQTGLLQAYRDAYAVGIAAALLVAAIVCLLSGLIVWLWFRYAARAADLRSATQRTGEERI